MAVRWKVLFGYAGFMIRTGTAWYIHIKVYVTERFFFYTTDPLIGNNEMSVYNSTVNMEAKL